MVTPIVSSHFCASVNPLQYDLFPCGLFVRHYLLPSTIQLKNREHFLENIDKMFPTHRDRVVMTDQRNINELLREKADINARLALIPYEGTPEIKAKGNNRYLYMRKRINGKMTSTYVDIYSEDLHQLLLRNAAEARSLRKKLRACEKQLATLGYSEDILSTQVQLNLDFARANMKSMIYEQAILEGVSTTFPQTEAIIENGIIHGMKATDVQKILNLKHAWEFVLDKDVLCCPSDFTMLSHIAGLVNEGFFTDGGRVRSVPVAIGGTSYTPPLPQESVIRESLVEIIEGQGNCVDKAIRLAMSCMKWQVFLDGNKRAAIIYANHYLISKGGGLLIVPESLVQEFRSLLVGHYEGTQTDELALFMREKCWRTFGE